MEGQQGKAAPAQPIPSLVPSLPARSPPTVPRHPHRSSPQPVPTSSAEQEKRGEQKGKEVADASKSRPTREEDVQRAAKQQKTRHPASRGQEKSDSPHPDSQLDGERKRRVTAVQTLSKSEQDLIVARKKLQSEEEARKSAELASEGYQKQHLEETQRLREKAEKLKEQSEKAKTKFEQAMNEAEQKGYELGRAETEKALRAEVPEVCRIFCARTWSVALDRAGVETSSELHKPENVYYPEAIRSSAPQSYQADTPSPAINPNEEVLSRNSPPGASPNKPTTASKAETVSQGFQQDLDSTVQSTGDITK
ncbi:ensconsin-like [Quercus lobata]|uniref:ensconsin-like n=1 Tax=Quercus lobata TaxID=97700 RepID=UPI001246ADA1|nr:ensconsin-like [Quercus lobata]